jgi:predicted dithiol-disulfide oxidoreductase (DUF899 family)
MNQPRIVSRDEWITARKALLAREKALTREHDALALERRRLPSVRIDKQYMFDTPDGSRTLAELFGKNSQLIVYHFMMGPTWPEGCPSCSFLMDHVDGGLVHLAQRDVSFVAVSRAPLAQVTAFKQRMGWQLPWVSSFGSDFNWDFQVSFTPDDVAAGRATYNYGTMSFPSDEAPGFSVFYKNDAGEVYHTYSTFGRGGEPLIGTYSLLDMVPKGRDEQDLPYTMAWVRHHDRYESHRGPSTASAAATCCES